jgi:hypothetical protein
MSVSPAADRARPAVNGVRTAIVGAPKRLATAKRSPCGSSSPAICGGRHTSGGWRDKCARDWRPRVGKPAVILATGDLPDASNRDLLIAIHATLQKILAAVEQPAKAKQRSPTDDGRHQALIEALANAMGDHDLPFTSAEVMRHAGVDHALDQALKAAGVSSTGELGALLRELSRRDLGAWHLTRDGRDWRLARI